MAMGASLSVTAEADEDVIEPAMPMAKRPAKAASPAQSRAGFSADALSALVNLGYAQGDAAQAVATIAGEAPEADTATLIRASLKLLAPKA
jgi:Holliday junction DNA helicase RuvA